MVNDSISYFVQNEVAWRNLPSLREWPERLIGWLHGFFPDVNERLFRWLSCVAIIAVAVLLRRGFTRLAFGLVRRIAGHAKTGIDEKLFISLTPPPGRASDGLGDLYGIVRCWNAAGDRRGRRPGCAGGVHRRCARGFWRAGGTALAHLEALARSRNLGIATFMPLVKKTLATFLGCWPYS